MGVQDIGHDNLSVPKSEQRRTDQTIQTTELRACTMCGACCKGAHRWGLLLVSGDYERWTNEGREDILQYVKQSAYGLYCAIVWRDPKTGISLDYCPFLVRLETGSYSCSIHETKPGVCRRFRCTWMLGKGKKCLAFKSYAWYKKGSTIGTATNDHLRAANLR